MNLYSKITEDNVDMYECYEGLCVCVCVCVCLCVCLCLLCICVSVCVCLCNFCEFFTFQILIGVQSTYAYSDRMSSSLSSCINVLYEYFYS